MIGAEINDAVAMNEGKSEATAPDNLTEATLDNEVYST
jgi:hypothetical protein